MSDQIQGLVRKNSKLSEKKKKISCKVVETTEADQVISQGFIFISSKYWAAVDKKTRINITRFVSQLLHKQKCNITFWLDCIGYLFTLAQLQFSDI